MSKIHFTKRALESLPVEDETKLYRDSAVRGLGVKVEPSAHKSFFWSRRTNGRLAWKTIGEFESVSLDDARAEATKYNAAVAKWSQSGFEGADPFVSPRAMTLGEAVTAYKERRILAHSKRPEKAAENIDWEMSRYGNGLRDRKLGQILKSDAVSLHERIGKAHGPIAANRFCQMLRTAINWTVEAGLWQGTNPFLNIQFFREAKRKRFLNAAELGQLARALAATDNLDLKDFVRLALFTGARKSDVMSMAWKDVDFSRATWSVPDPKSEPYSIALPVEAARILAERRARAESDAKRNRLAISEFVFPSHGASGHIVDLKKAWKRLLLSAGITELRQHDLRRTLGSWQAAGGASLQIIGASLGHRSLAATAVYARLQDAPVRASVEAATRAMTAEMERKPEPQRLLVATTGKRAARKK